MGPLELIVIEFDHNRFTGEIAPELRIALDKGVIRMIDLVFVRSESESKFSVTAVNKLAGYEYSHYSGILNDLQGLLTLEDIDTIVKSLPVNSSAAVILFEHVWAKALKNAVAHADGHIVMREYIPEDDLDSLSEEFAVTQCGRDVSI